MGLSGLNNNNKRKSQLGLNCCIETDGLDSGSLGVYWQSEAVSQSRVNRAILKIAPGFFYDESGLLLYRLSSALLLPCVCSRGEFPHLPLQ